MREPPVSSDNSNKDLRGRLSPQQYEVTQNAATERPFTGKYVDHKGDGNYRCICCEAPLF
ncbi:MAG: peptide-methionine (R)-S-oxide reductase, partial [Gammaproteobacteria bacterium]|nr:peptide-methionine (R)-S-oxide reductase [Gammaproteobacteria bacterium]